MNRYACRRRLILVGMVLLLGQQAMQAQAPSPLLRRLKETYASIESLRARFTYAVASEGHNPGASSTGTLTLQGPRYRVETSSQTVVTDGTATWIYNIAENQVIINDHAEDEVMGLLNDFLFGDTDLFDVIETATVQLDGASHHRLTLKPRAPDAAFREVSLWMRDRDNLVTRLTFTDLNEVQIQFALQGITLNPVLDEHTFTFIPPATAEIVDLRS